jgi:hypothetical protein
MLGEGKDYMLLRWWLATFPGLGGCPRKPQMSSR